MRRTLLIVIISLSFIAKGLCASRNVATESVRFHHIGKESGLSQISVMAIYQDLLGRMWFGTEEGLNIYDGTAVKPFSLISYPDKHGLQVGNEVYNIVGDDDGNVYFTADYDLFRYNLYTQQYTRLIDNNVQALYSKNDQLYIGVKDSVYAMNTTTQQKRLLCTLASRSGHATCFCVDKRGRLWIGTSNGLYIVSAKGGKPQRIITDHMIWSLYEDSRHNVWASTRSNGLYMIAQSGKQTHFVAQTGANAIASNQTRGITEDSFGNIWIGTFLGLNCYDHLTGTFSVYTHSHLSNSLSHNSVFPLYRDRQGTLWLGTYYGGVDYFNNREKIFSYYPEDPIENNGLSHPYVGHITEDNFGNLWIATEGGGLNCFNRKTKQFARYRMNSQGTSVAQNNIKDILLDKRKDQLIVATHTGGLSLLDLRTMNFRNLHLLSPQLRKQTGDRIICLSQLGDTLFYTSEKGIWMMNMQTEEVKQFFEDKQSNGNSYFIIDRKHRMWIANGGGLWCIPINKTKAKSRFYAYNTHGLGHFSVICMTQTRSGNLYFGTRGSGIYRYNATSDDFTCFSTKSSGMAGDYCYAIAETPKGNLLVSSDKGLTLLNPNDNTTLTMELGAALPLSGFNVGCGIYVCRDGEIFVGGIDGMASFRESQLTTRASKYTMYWSDLQVNNKSVMATDSTGILQRSVSYTDNIKLAYDENDIILDFATNNYIIPLHQPIYEYRLEGLDKRWTQTRDHRIHYTNISPDKYTLELRETSNHEHCLRMVIVVHPPIWATPWAYILYFLIVASIVYAFFRFKQQQFMLKTSLDMERREKQHIEQLNQAKLQFFTNISHEFRTPLTLILSHLELIMSAGDVMPSMKYRLSKVHKNAIHLRKLINELLDFRKLEQGYVQLRLQKTDLVAFLQAIFATFKDYADQRGINYSFTAKTESISCNIDIEQMEKVINNLLSNAFKYAKSEIGMSATVDDNNVIIRVTDDGIGIAPEDLNKIFERFYQVETSKNAIQSSPSTGIGLAMVKTIVELHHGKVWAESKQGYGSVFVISLPNTCADSVEAESSAPQPLDTIDKNANIESDKPFTDAETSSAEVKDTAYTVLLVEDNKELLQVLVTLFSPTCHTLTALNGEEGLQKVREAMPDIVVSDVMMPRMSGTELCTAIKSDPTVCHIPVVLLTALGTAEHVVSGLKLGADDYISKPFNAAILLARCNSIITNRRLLQRQVRKSETRDDVRLLATNAMDGKLLNDVNSIIERNLNNSEFTVDDIVRELAQSRTAFYSKFKSLTGMSPNDYILNYKLKRAADMLRESQDLQIKDITYSLGFSSPRYFSHCFKAQFGISPAEYRKRATSGT